MRKIATILYFLATMLLLAQPVVVAAETLSDEDQQSIYSDTVWYKMVGENCSVSQADSTGRSGSKTIVLDPGHAPVPSGSPRDSTTGLHTDDYPNPVEMDRAFTVAQKIGAELKSAGYQVVYTKTEVAPANFTLDKRAKIANDANPDLLFTIHGNDDGNDGITNPGPHDSRWLAYPDGGAYRVPKSGVRKDSTNGLVHPEIISPSKKLATELAPKIAAKANLRGSYPANSFSGVYGHDHFGPLGRDPGNTPVQTILSSVPSVYSEVSDGELNDAFANAVAAAIKQVVPLSGAASATTSAATSATGNSNLDYAGRPILNQGQLKAVKNRQSIYQQAAAQAKIPWQVLVGLHYRETGLSLDAPSNGDGQYQIINNSYPSSGTISEAEFLKQSIDAANFIKGKQSALNEQAQATVVKDAFYLYNGIPGDTYPKQAQKLGFNRDTQAYEGSPYVMNMADAKRDPNIPAVSASGNWLQARSVNGGIVFAAATNDFYGAYIVYASLAGTTLAGGCSSGSVNCQAGDAEPSAANLSAVRQNIVCVAKHELSLWNSGKMKIGTDYLKYEGSRTTREPWCADFASWVYNQAGYPFGPGGSNGDKWNIAWTGYFMVPPQDKTKFVVHAAAGYTPVPGDVALHSEPGNPWNHTNLVVAVNGSQITFIGGNQGGVSTTYHDGGDVSSRTVTGSTGEYIVYYVSPTGG